MKLHDQPDFPDFPAWKKCLFFSKIIDNLLSPIIFVNPYKWHMCPLAALPTSQ